DCFERADAQRLMCQVTLVFGIAPAIAPIIGGWIQSPFDWHAIFVFLVIFGTALGICAYRRLPETLPVDQRTPVHVGSMLRVYAGMLLDARPLLLTATATRNFSPLVTYIASAPVYVMSHLG